MRVVENYLDRIIFWRVDDVYDALKPFQFISWIFGFGFIDNRRLRRSDKSIVLEYTFLVLWLGLFAYLIYTHIAVDYYENWTESPVVNVVRRWSSIFALGLGYVFMLSSFLVRQRFTRMFERIMEIDRMLKSLQIDLNLKWESVKIHALNGVLYGSATLTVFISIYYVDDCVGPKLCFFTGSPIYFVMFTVNFFGIHYGVFMLSILNRYSLINSNIKRFTKLKMVYSTSDQQLKRAMTPVTKLACIHDKLTKCVDDMNFCFSMQIMLGLCGIFVFVVTTLFVVMRVFAFDDKRLSNVVGWFITWCVYVDVTVLLLTVFVSSAVIKRGKHTAFEVHRALYECYDPQIREELKNFSQQLTHRHPVVTCGLFIIDWTILFSIASAVTTYLMILVQFDSSFSEVNNSTTDCNC